MYLNIHLKAIHLLEKIANSVHERDPKTTNLMCFSSSEVQVVEQWLIEFIREQKQEKTQ